MTAPLTITSARFVRGVIGSTDFLGDPRPQVAFVGRSNVGKSSVINALVRRTNLVRTSSTPGKTLQINFFLINERCYFVDLPGYGYAKHAQKKREKLRRMILWYLTSPDEVRPAALVLIVDLKVGLTAFDEDLLRVAADQGHPVIILANKADKLTQKARAAALASLTAAARAHAAVRAVIPFSALRGRGRTDALRAIAPYCKKKDHAATDHAADTV